MFKVRKVPYVFGKESSEPADLGAGLDLGFDFEFLVNERWEVIQTAVVIDVNVIEQR